MKLMNTFSRRFITGLIALALICALPGTAQNYPNPGPGMQGFSPAAAGGAVDHAFTQTTTQFSTASTTYVDVTGASIASTEFVEGKTYLIHILANVSNSTGDNATIMKVRHGTTDFDNGDGHHVGDNANLYSVHGFLTVWTAVAGESINLQVRSPSASNALVDNVQMFALDLTGLVYYFAETFPDDAPDADGTDGAAITFTPGTAGHNWWVASNVRQGTSAGVANGSWIARSGEASSALPIVSQTAFGTARTKWLLSRVFNLGAASNTFTQVSSASSGTQTRFRSTIFALNLNQFVAHAVAYTEADVALSDTNYATQLQTLSITPTEIDDVWIGGFFGFNKNDAVRTAEFRLQIGNTDVPSDQTSDNRNFALGIAAADIEPLSIQTVQNLAASAHTVDLDGSADSTSGAPAGQTRQLWAVQLRR